jgi:putative aldouronate transport system permease protein
MQKSILTTRKLGADRRYGIDPLFGDGRRRGRVLRTLAKQRGLFLMMLVPAVVFVLFHYVPVIALLLNEIGVGWYKKGVQTIIYFPHFLSWVVIASIWFKVLAPQNSVNAEVATWLGLEPTYFFASPRHIRWILVMSDIWQGAGYGAIVYLAALTAISPDLYEAAIVDGANKARQIWHITLPGIRSTIVIMLILKVGDILDIFEQVLIMCKPIVRDVTDVIDLYAYRTGISQMEIGYAMAVSLFKAVIALVLVIATNRAARALGEEGVF